MAKQAPIFVLIAIAAIAVLIVNLNQPDAGAAERNAHRHFVCIEDGCGAEVTASVAEISKPGNYPECQTCGSRQLMPATVCGACAKFVQLEPHSIVPTNCPHCESEMNKWNSGAHRHGPNGEHLPDPEFLRLQAERENNPSSDPE